MYRYFIGRRPLGIITAFRGERDYKTNFKNNMVLEKEIRNADFGFKWIDGKWVETYIDGSYSEQFEISFLIVGKEKSEKESEMLYKLLIEQGNRFNQEAIVFQNYGIKEPIQIINPSTNKIEASFNRVKMNDISNTFSRFRSGKQAGKIFTFTEEQHITLRQIRALLDEIENEMASEVDPYELDYLRKQHLKFRRLQKEKLDEI